MVLPFEELSSLHVYSEYTLKFIYQILINIHYTEDTVLGLD